MGDVIIARMQPGEAAETAVVLSHVFQSNPSTVAVRGAVGENGRRGMETLIRLAVVERPFANILVARHGGRIVGACNAVEYPKCQSSPPASLRLLPGVLGLGLRAVLRAMKVRAARRKHHPREHHWHLGPIGVLPELQGRGIGSQMLARFCDIVDGHKAAAYLETDKPESVRWYERFGFVVIGETDVLGVHQWFMRRAPR